MLSGASCTVHKVYHRPQLLFFGGGGDKLLLNGGEIYIYPSGERFGFLGGRR